MNILLVYPRNPDSFWSFKHVLRFVAKRSAFPPLGLLTVAAMLPRQWHLRLIDINVEPLLDKDVLWADYVFLSAMIIHKDSAQEIAARCSSLGRKIVAGGPLFTTGFADFPEIDSFVLGEAEDLAAELVADIERDTLKAQYRSSGWPDIRTSPIPRWDLVKLANYVTMPIQFSRGCPFDCEFCDIVIMNGRTPRTKDPAQVIAELDDLRQRGWKDMVFIVDDNFIGNRKRVRELLGALIAWRKRTSSGIGFLTEASVNLADDHDTCQLMGEAGFKKVFVGIETPSEEGLKECNKRQNTRHDLGEAVRTIQRAGMEVMGGFIVGFDSDTKDIFSRQFDFIQQSGVVTAMVGLLIALPQTRLYRRLASEGRILFETTGNNTDVAINFATRLDADFLRDGYAELMHRLYEPRNYYRRIRTFLRTYQPQDTRRRLSINDLGAMAKSLWVLGARRPGRIQFWSLFWSTLLASPAKFRVAMELSIIGYHFRTIANHL